MILTLLKAEMKKLLTVRSTYFLLAIIILLTCMFTYLSTARTYVETGNAQTGDSSQTMPADTTENAQPPEQSNQANYVPQWTKDLPADKLKSNILETVVGAGSTFIVVAAILLMAHEYRYNTITYSLTLSKSRSGVLAAKILAVIIYTTVLTVIAALVTVAVTFVAVAMKDLNLPAQDINWLNLAARSLTYTVGFSLIGLAFITLVRNLTAGTVMVFVLPVIDSILAGLLRVNNIEPAKYLPFSALTRVASDYGPEIPTSLPTVTAAALIFAAYLGGVWVVAWLLFLRRDAS